MDTTTPNTTSPQPLPQTPYEKEKTLDHDPGLIWSVLSFAAFFVFFPAGIVLGLIGRSESKKAGYSGRLGLIGALVSGLLPIGLIVLGILFIIVIFARLPHDPYPQLAENTAIPYSQQEDIMQISAEMKSLKNYLVATKLPPSWQRNESRGVWCRFIANSTVPCDVYQYGISSSTDALEYIRVMSATPEEAESGPSYTEVGSYEGATPDYRFTYLVRKDGAKFSFNYAPRSGGVAQSPSSQSNAVVTSNYFLDFHEYHPTITNNKFFGRPQAATARDELLLYLQSAESFKEHALMKIADTQTAAKAEVDNPNSAFQAEYGCQGFGEGPDACHYKQLDPQQRSDLKQYIDTISNQNLQYIEANYQQMYDALVSITQYKDCPQCWTGVNN